MRTVTIACGHKEPLVEELRDLADRLEAGPDEEVVWVVEANDRSAPAFQLVLSYEADDDWREPVVEYSGQ